VKQLRNFLLKNKITPKWVIFILDVTICVAALLYANFLRFNDFAGLTDYNLALQILITVAANAVFFYLFKTYEGIIRFSGFQEAVRSFTAVFYSFFMLLVINIIFGLVDKTQFIPTSVLIIYFFISSFIVFGYRLLVKSLYRMSVTHEDTLNVVVYGGELNGSLLKRTIEQASNNKYQVVAFIDDDERFIGKSIDNIKIYSFEQVKPAMESWGIKLLFLAKQDFDLDLKNKVVDYCLEKNVTIKNIPPIKEWIQGQLNLKQLKNLKIDDLLGRPPISLINPSISKLLEDKVVMITGAAGSIGSEIARQVAALSPDKLLVFDQTETGLYELEYELQEKFQLKRKLRVCIGDVTDKPTLRKVFEDHKPHIVFHAAAYKHVPMMEHHPSQAIKNNVLGTKVLADLSEEFEVERFLLISTDKAINPTNVMGASKRIAEIYVQSLGNYGNRFNSLFVPKTNGHLNGNGHSNGNGHLNVNSNGHLNGHNGHIEHDQLLPNYSGINNRGGKTKFITTRFGNVLGSNGSVIPRFKEQIDKGGPITVTHPDIIRYFMTIPEACGLVLEAVTMGSGGEIFLFDMGEPVKIVDLAKKMIRLAGLELGKDIEIQFTGLRPGEKLYEELLNKEEEVVPTHNKKILIAKVREYDFELVNQSITSLIDLASNLSDEEVVKNMKKIVPEYISNNSKFEVLDEALTTSPELV
jgi:FlaA1/EpsC-like NDP-sugar epimerase